jgi:hypothetical protein
MFTLAIVTGLVFVQTPQVEPNADAAKVAPKQLRRQLPIGLEEIYGYSALLTSERRDPRMNLDTYLPETQRLMYQFKLNVKEKKADDIVVLDYLRTGFKVAVEGGAEGEQYIPMDGGNLNFKITLSPTNAVLDLVDISPKKPEKKVKDENVMWLRRLQDGGVVSGQALTQQVVGQFFQELQRMSLMIGSLDSSMDFAPKLPDEEVVPGDTWEETVSYQPQRARGTKSTTVQRLDMTYTYVGLVKVNGKPFEQIKGSVTMDANLKDYIDGAYGIPKAQSPFKSVNVKFQMNSVFNLDPKSLRTVYAEVRSNGNLSTDFDFQGMRTTSEDRFTGEAKIANRSAKIIAPVKTKAKPAKKPKN